MFGMATMTNAALIAHWGFDETDGTTAFDSVGGVNGTLFGGATFIPTGGVAGGAIQFTNGYVDMGNNFASIPTFSVQVWIKTDPGDTSPMTPVAKHKAGITEGYYLSINNVNDGYTRANIAGFRSMNHYSNATATGNPAVNDGLWHQLVGVYNRGTSSLYVDGNFVASTYSNGYSDNSADFIVGGLFDYGEAPGNAFHGLIDEVSVYNNALSGDDVKTFYDSTLNQVVPTPYTSLFGNTIKTEANYEFTIEQNALEEFSIQLTNPGDDTQSVTLEVINPHSDLTVSLTQQNPVTLAPGDVLDIPLSINAGSMPVGVYDDLLLKLTVENGETLYSNIKVTVVEQGSADLPDLSISSQDIQLSDYPLGESAILNAVIHNKGQTAASNVQVQFYEFGSLLGEIVLDKVPAEGNGTASITVPITTSGEHLIRVVVDFSDTIDELDETNNEASQMIKIGSPAPVPGSILVTGSLPTTVYTNELFTISGRAAYDVYVDGVRYTNYVVKGGSVQITIKDDAGHEWVYGGGHTNINGYFARTVQAPASIGTYHISMTVTDETLSGKRDLLFSVTERPPLPPLPLPRYGPGSWTYVPASSTSPAKWKWVWITSPVNAPLLETDLQVFSENIHFSKFNPDPGEEITIFAEINYWATSTDLVAQDVPVNFYVTYPGTPKMKIGETTIDRLSVGAPDFGSRYVYTSWKNRGKGLYIIEVEIDPDYVEKNNLNNAATRAIIVGRLQSQQGAIAGQVTDPWGGVSNVMIELYDSGGTTLIENKLTDDTGYYLFENVPVDDYQVHIVKPKDYRVDAETKSAEVTDQAVTEVDFHLIGQELPVAKAGPDQNVLTGSRVTLDGSGSTDANGDSLSYNWSFVSRPAGSSAVLSDATVVKPTFTADVDGKYVLQLVVNDGTVDSSPDVTVVSASGNSVNDGGGGCTIGGSNSVDFSFPIFLLLTVLYLFKKNRQITKKT